MDELKFLTNDAKYLLTALYKEYVSRRTSKVPKERATKFDDVHSIHQNFMPEWSIEDIEFTCFELHKHDLIHAVLASNSLYNIRLSTEAIALLEVTFMDKVDSAFFFMRKIKESIPFL
ncbi:hypothetical protein NHG28_06400 [Aerococcaceae bacterium NML201209]|nr:hypothetical protein [Aerococcaceae bacterium NML201209]